MGGLALQVPGALQVVASCLPLLAVSLEPSHAKRIVALCSAGVDSKDWQVRGAHGVARHARGRAQLQAMGLQYIHTLQPMTANPALLEPATCFRFEARVCGILLHKE